jgi:phage shock protein PspC (stress-responsive transcriptional regulator)
MKKIININLSGRVIPIEDAAYESLQRYIESLRRYFANEEGRDEIINDIESRVAELMNDKIKKGATAVTEADIEEIITAMGRIEDFEQADATEGATSSTTTEEPFINIKTKRGRLYRDSSDKLLGGVCSGIANYLNIDPAIIRIILVLLIFGAGTGILLYILLWIILPARPLDGTVVSKRLFRNPEDRILGGVAGGLAAYFNRETWVIRLIFAAPLVLNILFGVLNGIFFAFHGDIFPNFFIGSFTGTFILAYVVLWIILPEAKSTYDKMEMRGETVDVNRIKQNVQEGMGDFKNRAQAWGGEVKESAQNLGKRASEFANTRGKTFAAEAGQAARPIANGLGHVIGMLFKIFFLFVLGVIAFSLFVIVLVFTIGGVARPFNDFMLNGFWQNASLWGTLIFFLAVPLIAIITWIVRRLMKVKSHNSYLGWTFGSLWTLGWISLIIFIASMAKDFRYYDNVSSNVTIAQPTNKMIVRVDEQEIRYSGTFDWLNNNDDDNGWDLTEDSVKFSHVKIRLDKSEDSSYHVTLYKYSAGSNRNDARRRAEKVQYSVSSLDSALLLGSGYGVSKNEKFRGQKVMIEIRIPVGKHIRFDGSVIDKLNHTSIRIKERNDNFRYRREWDMDWDNDSFFDYKPNVDYTMNADGELVDASQPVQKNNEVYEYKTNNDSLRKSIEARERQLEEDKRRLQEAEDTQRTSLFQLKKIKKVKAKAVTANISFPVFSLII